MFHLFQHKSGKLKGKYDFAFVKNGKYICGSSQGYERKRSVVSAIHSVVSNFNDSNFYLQDDTDSLPGIFIISKGTKFHWFIQDNMKPRKKYIPQSKK